MATRETLRIVKFGDRRNENGCWFQHAFLRSLRPWRRAQEEKLKRESGSKKDQVTRDESEQRDRDQEHDLFFWSLYPVI